MNKKTIIGTVFSVLLLSGCGGGGSTADYTLDTGTWSDGCESFGIGSIVGAIDINGSSGIFSVDEYDNETCTGTPTNTFTAPLAFSYPGEISIEGYYNCQKIDLSIQYPVLIDGIEYDENQYALLSEDDQPIEAIDVYDILCTNEAGTILYSGDETTGDGTSDATRPTSIDSDSGLSLQL